MPTGHLQLKKTLIFLLAGALILWAETGRAFEPWTAETTATVNLRKAPGLYGKIISRVTQGKTGEILWTDTNGIGVKFEKSRQPGTRDSEKCAYLQ